MTRWLVVLPFAFYAGYTLAGVALGPTWPAAFHGAGCLAGAAVVFVWIRPRRET